MVVDKSWKNFEAHDKAKIALNSLWVEIRTLRTKLVRVQKEVRSMREEACIILQNMYIVINRISNIKGATWGLKRK